MSHDVDSMRHEVIEGLKRRPRYLPAKFFYDALGSKLFEAITFTPEYYPTDCELQILRRHGAEIGEVVGTDAAVIELGPGSALKAVVLLESLHDVRAYVPVDISGAALAEAVVQVRLAFPAVRVDPLVADFTRPLRLPRFEKGARRVVFYPGSTIGNLEPQAATAFISTIASWLEPGDLLLIGFDLVKDPAVLEAAYNDAAGVTAAFNKNMLLHLNRAVGSDFDASGWAHEAYWNPDHDRIEMHLRCLRDTTVHIGASTFRFSEGDDIHSESSHKFRLEGFDQMASVAGFERVKAWTDDKGWFAVVAYAKR